MKKRTFSRGVHPPSSKSRTADKRIERLPAPEKVILPLQQSLGRAAVAVVSVGDSVAMGQEVGRAPSAVSAAVHSPVSGKVLAIEPGPHPSGVPSAAITIANDGQDRRLPEWTGMTDPFLLTGEEVLDRVRRAGVVGLGGAAFPTAVKLSPPPGKDIHTVVLNGCECEPYLTGDYRLMLESPREVLRGAELIRRTVGARRLAVAVEDDKADALEALKSQAGGFPAEFFLMRTKYPQGAERNLIKAMFEWEVPNKGGLPYEVGVIVQNVGTAKAVWEAAAFGKPLIERVLTVSGPGMADPKNLLVRLGTPLRQAVAFCGGLLDGVNLLVMGGPLMGISQASLDVPVIKGTSGILAFQGAASAREYPCIRCARCVAHCPMGLLPTELARWVRHGRYDAAEQAGNMDCVECGCCQFICPARIPLVHWLRLGKSTILLRRCKVVVP